MAFGVYSKGQSHQAKYSIKIQGLYFYHVHFKNVCGKSTFAKHVIN